nr:DUF456 family protein [Lysinibacillus timonensis]
MEIIAWTSIIVCFVIAFVGLVYPIIPSVIFMLLGFILYGVFFSFDTLSWWFWTVEVLLVILLFVADTISNIIGVKKFGGSKAGLWGSTIGLLIGPFIIPFAGILLGPFLGAIIGELIITKSTIFQAVKSGFGSVIGFLSSIVTKGAIQIIMIIIFVLEI